MKASTKLDKELKSLKSTFGTQGSNPKSQNAIKTKEPNQTAEPVPESQEDNQVTKDASKALTRATDLPTKSTIAHNTIEEEEKSGDKQDKRTPPSSSKKSKKGSARQTPRKRKKIKGVGSGKSSLRSASRGSGSKTRQSPISSSFRLMKVDPESLKRKTPVSYGMLSDDEPDSNGSKKPLRKFIPNEREGSKKGSLKRTTKPGNKSNKI